MNDIEKWVKDYSLEKGVNYEQIIIEAVKFYKEFVEGSGKNYYNLGKNLKKFIEENTEYLLEVPKQSDEIKEKQCEEIRFGVIQEFDEKEKYLKGMENINSNLINIILSDRTIILEALENDKIAASIIMSFENFETEEVKYAFVHYVRIMNSQYKKIYSAVENKILDLAKKFGASRVDRVISNDLFNNFKNMRYTQLYRNYYLEVDISSPNSNVLEYEKEVKHHVSSRYVTISKMCPERFQERSNMNNTYKFSMRSGKFYAQIKIKEDKAFVNLYFDKGKLNRAEYVMASYYIIVNYLKKNNIKKLYTLIDNRHINVLGSIENARKIKEWVWIRKLL